MKFKKGDLVRLTSAAGYGSFEYIKHAYNLTKDGKYVVINANKLSHYMTILNDDGDEQYIHEAQFGLLE